MANQKPRNAWADRLKFSLEIFFGRFLFWSNSLVQFEHFLPLFFFSVSLIFLFPTEKKFNQREFVKMSCKWKCRSLKFALGWNIFRRVLQLAVYTKRTSSMFKTLYVKLLSKFYQRFFIWSISPVDSNEFLHRTHLCSQLCYWLRKIQQQRFQWDTLSWHRN